MLRGQRAAVAVGLNPSLYTRLVRVLLMNLARLHEMGEQATQKLEIRNRALAQNRFAGSSNWKQVLGDRPA